MKIYTGKIIWFGHNSKSNEKKDYGFISRDKSPDLYFNRDQVKCNPDLLIAGTQVSFGIGTDLCTKREYAKDVKLVIQSDVVRSNSYVNNFHSKDPKIWMRAAVGYFKIISEEEIKSEYTNKLKDLKEAEKHFLFHCLPKNLQLSKDGGMFRQVLDKESHLLICREMWRLYPQDRNWIKEEMREVYRKYPESTLVLPSVGQNEVNEKTSVTPKLNFREISKSLQDSPEDPLLVIQRRYSALISFLENFIRSHPHIHEWHPRSIYKLLTPKDEELAISWIHRVSDYEKERMVSARGAELAAQSFYRSLNYNVIDTALRQLDGSGDEWKICDFILNNEVFIDVKNARTPVNSSSLYSEHCIPRFKQSRQNQDVIIAGVFSPYMKISQIKNQSPLSKSTRNITFLGETSKSKIELLKIRFETNFLTIIPYDRTIPPWVFDYPDTFYAEFDRRCATLRELVHNDNKIPRSDMLFSGKYFNPIPAFLASKLPLPESWCEELRPFQQELYKRLQSSFDKRPNLPGIFLTLLSHFLEVVSNRSSVGSDFHPMKYRRLLFDNDNRSLPLGICDPLQICYNLCSSLEHLWNHRAKLNLNNFHIFKFRGLGILQGKRSISEAYTALMAYCGGFVEGKGHCGYSPLILGKHEVCQNCNKLICKECYYCSEHCEFYKKRLDSLVEGKQARSYYSYETQDFEYAKAPF